MEATATKTTKVEKPKKSLDYILKDKKALDELLDSTDGELDSTLEEWLDEVYKDVEAKVDNIGGLIRHLELEASNHKSFEESFAQKRKAREAQVKKIKEHFKNLMSYRGVAKLEGEAFTLAVQKNGGLAPIKFLPPFDKEFNDETVKMISEEYLPNVPKELTRTIVVLDTDKLREYLSSEEKKAHLEFAVKLEHGTHLRVK